MIKTVRNYFAEFKVLRTASKDFWLVNILNFLDGMAYFSMMNVFSLYLTRNCGFSDFDSGKWIGIWSLLITAFVFGIGSICDAIGIKKTFGIGVVLLLGSRLAYGLVPLFVKDSATLQGIIILLMITLSFGTAIMGPVMSAAIRRFTTPENRSTGFNIWYLLMNVGAILSGFAVTDGLRGLFGDVNGNLAIMLFGATMNIISFICIMFINENNYADKSEIVTEKSDKRPIKIFLEVWKEKAFQKLVVFLVLTLGVRLIFTHQFLVMPKYYTRVMQGDFELGFANSINPIIIVAGLILFIPLLNRFKTFNLVVLGMSISATSLLFMAAPIQWIFSLPGIHNYDQAYTFIIYAQIIVFAVGELIFSPRFTEYTAMIAPKDKVASYMALSVLPTFISKPINGFLSGILISSYSYEGIRAKIDTGNLTYQSSPEFMWFVYLIPAIISPLAVIMMKNYINRDHEEKSEAPSAA